MNFKQIFLSLALLTPISYLTASDADNKRGSDFHSSISSAEWNSMKGYGHIGSDIERWERTAENFKTANTRLATNQARIQEKMDTWSEKAELKKTYPYPWRGNPSSYQSIDRVHSEIYNQVIKTFIFGLATGVVKISFDWFMTSKEEQLERKAALKYANMQAHDQVLTRQYQTLAHTRSVVNETRKAAATIKDAEQRKAVLEQCDLRDKELNDLQCKLNDAIFNFNKTRSEFLNPTKEPAQPAQPDAKQALTQQATAHDASKAKPASLAAA